MQYLVKKVEVNMDVLMLTRLYLSASSMDLGSMYQIITSVDSFAGVFIGKKCVNLVIP